MHSGQELRLWKQTDKFKIPALPLNCYAILNKFMSLPKFPFLHV